MTQTLLRGIGISLFFHGMAVCSVIYFGKVLPTKSLVLALDFSIEKAEAPSFVAVVDPSPQATLKEIKMKQPATHFPASSALSINAPSSNKKVRGKQAVAEAEKQWPIQITANQTKQRMAVKNPKFRTADKTKPDDTPPQIDRQQTARPSSAESHAEMQQAAPKQPTTQATEIISVNKHPPSVSSPSTAQSSPSPREKYIQAHLSSIREAIERNTSYPAIARRMGWEGRVLVSFIVQTSGQVENIRILKSCGFKALDNNAIKTIERCSPFPKPPVQAELTLPITYRLR